MVFLWNKVVELTSDGVVLYCTPTSFHGGGSFLPTVLVGVSNVVGENAIDSAYYIYLYLSALFADIFTLLTLNGTGEK